MQVIGVGTLTKILVNNSPPPHPSPPSNVEFWWPNAHLYKKNYLPTFVNIVLRGGGGGGGGGDYAEIVPLKITIVVPNNSLVIFLDGFHKCPNYFWPPLQLPKSGAVNRQIG